jgi:hypothetical protein
MNRVVIHGVVSLLAFACGITTSALLAWRQRPAESSRPRAEVVVSPATERMPQAVVTTTLEPEIVFGRGRLKLVPDEVRLNSDRFHYQIDVIYPQVVGSEDDVYIRRLNQRIKQLVTERYHWPLTITEAELSQSLRLHPEPYNTVDIFYGVDFAGDSVLSIYFGEESYGIGAAHTVQKSFVVNYDSASNKELKLADLFAPGSKYLQFISRYCKNEFERQGHADSILPDSLAPASGNFQSWNVTPAGIRFNFDACTVFGCSGGQTEVEIPYSDLKPILSSRAMSILPISSVVKVKADNK